MHKQIVAVSINLHRCDIHEEACVKTGARGTRNFLDIHWASSAVAARRE
jgi:hypothetical protein